jgi:hypothetical protein
MALRVTCSAIVVAAFAACGCQPSNQASVDTAAAAPANDRPKFLPGMLNTQIEAQY